MLRLLILMAILAAVLGAEDIEGTILVTKKLTRRNVTAAVPIYQRGAGVELAKDQAEDPLAFERSRVVVWLDTPLKPQPVNASIEQIGRRFSPDLLIIPAGSVVSFPNMDPIFHNVFSLSKPKEFDLGNYPKGDTRKVTFSKTGIVYVNCHLHPNMSAAIVIAPSRWYARSDASGRFTLSDVPPGEYTVFAWHKAAGFFRKRIQVVSGQPTHIEFLIPLAPEANSPLLAAGN